MLIAWFVAAQQETQRDPRHTAHSIAFSKLEHTGGHVLPKDNQPGASHMQKQVGCKVPCQRRVI